jgi:hypothetical protein
LVSAEPLPSPAPVSADPLPSSSTVGIDPIPFPGPAGEDLVAEISVVTIPEFTADLIIDIVNETIADSVPSFSSNTPLIVTDFEVGNDGDSLNFDELLNNLAIDYDGSNAFSNGYIGLMQNGNDTIVSFDIDGIGGDVSSVVLSTLQNVDMSLFGNNNVDSEVDIQVIIPTSVNTELEVLEADPIISQMVEEEATSTVAFEVGPVGDDLDPITNQVVVSTETSTFTDATDPITNQVVVSTETSTFTDATDPITNLAVESAETSTLLNDTDPVINQVDNTVTTPTSFEDITITPIEASTEIEAAMAGSTPIAEPVSSSSNLMVVAGPITAPDQATGGMANDPLV